MPNLSSHIILDGISIEVWRKPTRNVRLVVLPISGKVRISVPASADDEQVRVHLMARLDWIKKQLARVKTPFRIADLRLEDGETLFLEGKAYRLKLFEDQSINRIVVRDDGIIELRLKPGITPAGKMLLMLNWYYSRLQPRAEALLKSWRSKIGVQLREWGIKQMKVRWGSCNVDTRRIWLSLELAAHSDQILEFIVVHELMHLLEAGHGHRFKELMDNWLPDWRERDRALKNFGA